MKIQILIQEVWMAPEICISDSLPGNVLDATSPGTTFDYQGSSTFLPPGWSTWKEKL